MLFAETYVELMKDPAHWGMELTIMVLVDGLLLGVTWPIVKRLVRKHDKEHH